MRKHTITNRRGRAVNVRLPAGGNLALPAEGSIERWLSEPQAAALGNSAKIDVEPVADPPEPEPESETELARKPDLDSAPALAAQPSPPEPIPVESFETVDALDDEAPRKRKR